MIELVLGWLVVAVWLWLLVLRGRFWLIEPSAMAEEPSSWPAVVAIIPARNEAETIGEAVRSVLAQDYPGSLHLIVVDDQSTDQTPAIARAAGASVVSGTAPPAGWTGKLWALAQGVAAAGSAHGEADIYLFTDADINHATGELKRMAARLTADRLDLASLMVRLATQSWAEKAIVPAFVYFFRLLYPFRWVGKARGRTAAAAGGYVLIRRMALARIGGLATVKGALIDDCALAAAIKGGGGRIRLELAHETRSLRPYGWSDLWRMIARSAFTQLRHSPLLLIGTIAGLSLGFLAPPVLAVLGEPGWMPALLAWLLMAVSYVPMLTFYGLLPLWAPLLPLIALFYLGATVDSARRHWNGRGGEWNGRIQGRGRVA